MTSIPVFMYHHVNEHVEDLVTLSPRDFENHLQVLAAKGIQTIFLDELIDYLKGERRLSKPCVALTFDDGHLDNWVYAYPLLKKYQMRATIFVITSWMGGGKKRKYWEVENSPTPDLPPIPHHKEVKKRALEGDPSVALQWEEAQEMEASGLVDIQSHTHFHREYFYEREKKTHLDPGRKDEFLNDLKLSKDRIQSHLRKKCRFLAWPWGKHDEEAVALAGQAGYEGIVTTEKGVNFPGSDPFSIKRVVAKSGDAGWFSTRIWIYSHPFIGGFYSRVVGKI